MDVDSCQLRRVWIHEYGVPERMLIQKEIICSISGITLATRGIPLANKRIPLPDSGFL